MIKVSENFITTITANKKFYIKGNIMKKNYLKFSHYHYITFEYINVNIYIFFDIFTYFFIY